MPEDMRGGGVGVEFSNRHRAGIVVFSTKHPRKSTIAQRFTTVGWKAYKSISTTDINVKVLL